MILVICGRDSVAQRGTLMKQGLLYSLRHIRHLTLWAIPKKSRPNQICKQQQQIKRAKLEGLDPGDVTCYLMTVGRRSFSVDRSSLLPLSAEAVARAVRTSNCSNACRSNRILRAFTKPSTSAFTQCLRNAFIPHRCPFHSC